MCLAGGVLLETLTAHTVDASGAEAFVTDNVMQLLRKVWPGREQPSLP
jgi:hypothetical protein